MVWRSKYLSILVINPLFRIPGHALAGHIQAPGAAVTGLPGAIRGSTVFRLAIARGTVPRQPENSSANLRPVVPARILVQLGGYRNHARHLIWWDTQ
jgi:hypothetical protein